jgi:hypothetical protein
MTPVIQPYKHCCIQRKDRSDNELRIGDCAFLRRISISGSPLKMRSHWRPQEVSVLDCMGFIVTILTLKRREEGPHKLICALRRLVFLRQA